MPQFLILANDYKDAGALSRRLSVREEHLKRARKEKLQGKFILGGAKLNVFNQMHGSMMLVEMEDENAVSNGWTLIPM